MVLNWLNITQQRKLLFVSHKFQWKLMPGIHQEIYMKFQYLQNLLYNNIEITKIN